MSLVVRLIWGVVAVVAYSATVYMAYHNVAERLPGRFWIPPGYTFFVGVVATWLVFR